MDVISPMLDRESEIPLYAQLYSRIRNGIETGQWAKGDKLPSIRELSANLLVSKNTVEIAYRQLIAEGYAESLPRSGLRVLQVEPVMGKPAAAGPGRRDGTARREADAKPPDIDFQYGRVELERFPLKSWKKCLTEALETDLAGVLGYGEIEGNAELRAEIARYLLASRGVACDPGRIFLAAGTQHAVGLLCRLLPLQGPIGMEEPGYDGVRAVLEDHRLEVVPIPAEDDGLDVEALRRSAAKAVYATPAHHFPLGGVLPVRKRNLLLQWAEDSGGYVIEDDYDSEFRYEGQPIPALKSMDAHDRVIYLGTFSKSFLPAARISYIVLPERLSEGFRERLSPYSQAVSPLLQQAVLQFMREGHFERHVRKTKKLYQVRHQALLDAIRRHLGDRVEVIGQKAGLHLLVNIPGRDGEELALRAARVGVKVYSTSRYWNRREGRTLSCVMLGFGGLRESVIEQGILRLKKAWFEDGEER